MSDFDPNRLTPEWARIREIETGPEILRGPSEPHLESLDEPPPRILSFNEHQRFLNGQSLPPDAIFDREGQLQEWVVRQYQFQEPAHVRDETECHMTRYESEYERLLRLRQQQGCVPPNTMTIKYDDGTVMARINNGGEYTFVPVVKDEYGIYRMVFPVRKNETAQEDGGTHQTDDSPTTEQGSGRPSGPRDTRAPTVHEEAYINWINETEEAKKKAAEDAEEARQRRIQKVQDKYDAERERAESRARQAGTTASPEQRGDSVAGTYTSDIEQIRRAALQSSVSSEDIERQSNRIAHAVAALTTFAVGAAMLSSRSQPVDRDEVLRELNNGQRDRIEQVQGNDGEGQPETESNDKKLKSPKIVEDAISSFNEIAPDPDAMDILDQVNKHNFDARTDVYTLKDEYGIEGLRPGRRKNKPMWRKVRPRELPVEIVDISSAWRLEAGFYKDQNGSKLRGGYLIWETDSNGRRNLLTHFAIAPSKEEADNYIANST